MRLTCSNLRQIRLDGSNLYSNIIKHCKRLVLWLILARLIKSMLARSKTLKTSNTRL
uniref:Uncharacterized protein n=1 Tax=Siphoviridae sp. ct7yc1 TaxID=2827788 RepID=A0A8S5TJD8_9CAUD|nr:MAG TPA: hypothetical protein [Siphoviridae sp. ct7yc1]